MDLSDLPDELKEIIFEYLWNKDISLKALEYIVKDDRRLILRNSENFEHFYPRINEFDDDEKILIMRDFSKNLNYVNEYLMRKNYEPINLDNLYYSIFPYSMNENKLVELIDNLNINEMNVENVDELIEENNLQEAYNNYKNNKINYTNELTFEEEEEMNDNNNNHFISWLSNNGCNLF